MATQDIGQYIYPIRANGLRLKSNEPLVIGGTMTSGGISTGTPATLASAATIAFTPTKAVTTHTPTQSETINFSAPGTAGTEIWLEVVTSGTSTYTLTFGTNTKTTGTLATGTTSAKTFLVNFVSDGTNWVESARTTAM
jgi:hypothetical protein